MSFDSSPQQAQGQGASPPHGDLRPLALGIGERGSILPLVRRQRSRSGGALADRTAAPSWLPPLIRMARALPITLRDGDGDGERGPALRPPPPSRSGGATCPGGGHLPAPASNNNPASDPNTCAVVLRWLQLRIHLPRCGFLGSNEIRFPSSPSQGCWSHDAGFSPGRPYGGVNAGGISPPHGVKVAMEMEVEQKGKKVPKPLKQKNKNVPESLKQ